MTETQLPSEPLIKAEIKRIETDWFRMFDMFRRAGWWTAQISAATKIPKSRLKGYYVRGYEPRHGDGDALIQLYCQVFGCQIEDVPTEHRPFSAASARRM